MDNDTTTDPELVIDLTERTLHGTSKGDGVNWRSYGLVWSPRRGCYVWARNIRPETVQWRAEQIAAAHGATVTGEAAADDRDADERDAAIAARNQARAEAATATRDAAEATFRQIGDAIPIGQPILVGHHSERRHRRDLDRMDRALSTIVQAGDDAKTFARRAEAAERRIEHRAAVAEATPVPLDLLAPGFTVEEWYKDGRRRKWTVTKVNRKTVSWAELGCSGKIEADRLYRAWNTDGVQVWPSEERS